MQLKNQGLLFCMRASGYGTAVKTESHLILKMKDRLEMAYDDSILLPMSVITKYSSVLIGCK